jgi:hypothetical protein
VSFCTPLSKDEAEMERWVKDPKKWNDVFGVKPYEYLQVILNGEEPWFDKNIGKWVSKTEFETNRNKVNEDANNKITSAEAQFKTTTSTSAQNSVTNPQNPIYTVANSPDSNIMDSIMLNDDDEEDLPF